MSDFLAQRCNVGIESLPQFQVCIVLTNFGFEKNGPPKAIPNCATVSDLDQQCDRLIKSLESARAIARGILEENQGECGYDDSN